MSLYRKILRQAWEITWRIKYLWFFGLFAALLGNGGEYELLVRGISGDIQTSIFPGLRGFYETGLISWGTLVNLKNLLMSEPFAAITIIFFWLLILVLFGFLIWLVVVSQAALVNNTALTVGGKKTDFQKLITAGMGKFWQVLTLNIIMKIIVAVVFLLIGLPLVLSITKASNLLFSFLFVLFIPFVMAVSFIIRYSIGYIVIKNYNLVDGIKAGWKLFMKNWLVSLEMAFILYAISFLIVMALVLISLILSVPFLFLALLFAKLASSLSFWVVTMITLCLGFLFVILLGAMLATFQTTAWASLFVELEGRGAMSKIMRVLNPKK